ncbi:MAG: alpha/beta hydrolase [Crocosphaera sp.]|nr:alpha/beta hydrolase [Crocosphaera sp.]
MNTNASATIDDRIQFCKYESEDKEKSDTNTEIEAYLAISKASINVDDSEENLQLSCPSPEFKPSNCNEIVDSFNQKDETLKKELVIMIHGYKTEKEAAKEEYKKRFEFIKEQFNTIKNRKLVLIGYTWPSEDFLKNFGNYFYEALKTLPIPFEIINNLLFLITFSIFSFICFINSIAVIIPIIFGIFAISNLILLLSFLLGWWVKQKSKFQIDVVSMVFFIITIVYWFFLDFIIDAFDLDPLFYKIIILLSIIGSIYLGIVLTFIILRTTNYFRDKYRAMFFAVADLVELIKNLNSKLGDEGSNEITLSFIAHSMGSFVATHTIRTLYNAFENGQTNNSEANNNSGNSKNTDLGKHFLLGRLVLASPDISIQAIFPGKSNVLETAIDKCQEAYLFSNQGDMILRVFSMITNYFIFPAQSAERGFRLGNIIVCDREKNDNDYTTLNQKQNMDTTTFLKNLQIVYRGKPTSLFKLLNNPQKLPKSIVTMQVSYFDCTDCRDNIRDTNDDWSKELKPILSKAENHQIICVMQCLELLKQWVVGNIDIHGGYFNGKFCQTMIYGLACLGWNDFNGIWLQCRNKHQASTLLEECATRKIQGLLSPELSRTKETQIKETCW